MFEWLDIFNSLSSNELNSLEMFCQERDYTIWDILFSQWEEANAMYILKSWLMRAYNYEKILWLIQPWDFIWEMAIFSPHKTRTATVEVIEDSSVIVLLSFSILELRSSHPEILEKITEVIEEKSSLVEHVEFITCTLLSSIIDWDGILV